MPDKPREEESSAFKVNDRRLFNSEGERRQEPARETPPPSSSLGAAKAEEPQGPSSTEQSAAAEEYRSHGGAPAGPIGFSHLVMYLATSAMYHMGLAPDGSEASPTVELPSAKQAIDMLEVLQKKSSGNLTDDEKRMIEGSLFELRMVFVELSKRGQGR